MTLSVIRGAAGAAILFWPDTPWAVRVLGLLCLACSLLALLPKRRRVPAEIMPTENPSLVLASAPASPDMDTAMRLLGSTIVEQVDTSVSTVLNKNQEMREVASEMAGAAAQAKEQFHHSMQRATESEASIEELQSFSGELAGSIKEIGAAVTHSIGIVRNATAQAVETRACVEMMTGLSDSVYQVIQLIDNIARQTRMLSLNATIEAARAGDAGRGFAVVADEVKLLAQQTAEATRTIDAKIGEMSAMVARSVSALQALVSLIESVDAASGSIGHAITEQENLAGRVSSSLANMREAVFTLSREIREAAQIAANSGMMADLVLETANSVDGLMTGLNGNLRAIGERMIPVVAAG